MIYLDYASTTKISSENKKLYNRVNEDLFRIESVDLNCQKIEDYAKGEILKALNLRSNYKVIFTNSGTEANNLSIIGMAKNFSNKKHFITTKIEHQSVYNCFTHLEEIGHKVTFLDVNENGNINLDDLEQAINNNTVLVSIMAVNNEIGSIQDVDKIKEIITRKNKKTIFMSDCVQAVGKVPIDYQKLDIITISSHKLYGSKSSGCIVLKDNIIIKPLLYGGYDQSGVQSGTMSLALKMVLANSIKTEMKEISSTISKIEFLKSYLFSQLENTNIKYNSINKSSIISMVIPVNINSEIIMNLLIKQEIYVSTKAACSTRQNKKSRILLNIGIDENEIDHVLRVSLSRHSTTDELKIFSDQIKEIIKKN